MASTVGVDMDIDREGWQRFEDLYRSSRDDVFAYVATMLRDRAAAEDVTELAFERAYRRRRTFDRRRGEERAWLFGIARNAALDELRRRNRVAKLLADPEDQAAQPVDEGAEVALARTTVRQALAKLPARERELVSLEAIDATLAGGPVAPLHAELTELSLLLADERPAIDPVFAHTLDERVRARFPDRKDRRPARSGWLRRRWAWVASGAVTAAAVAVIVVLVASGGGGDRIGEDLSGPARSSSAQSSAASSAAPNAASSAGSSAGSSAAPVRGPSIGHKLIQSAQLALTTPPDHVDDVAQEVFDVVGQQNGFVVRSSVTQTGGTDGSASLQLSVPSASLPETMLKLSRLRYARVSSRTDNSQDVNNQYGQATRRLADARALHTALLKQLAGATTTEQVDSLHAQIRDADRAISRDESSLAALKHRIAYSSVSLTIAARPRPAGTPTHHGGGFTLGRAARDAGHVLTVAAGVALIGLAALIPVALVVGLAWLIAGLLTHRRRERALDLA